jgi:hypothetical protein
MPLIQPASLALKPHAAVISGIIAAKIAISARFAINPNAIGAVSRLLRAKITVAYRKCAAIQPWLARRHARSLRCGPKGSDWSVAIAAKPRMPVASANRIPP